MAPFSAEQCLDEDATAAAATLLTSTPQGPTASPVRTARAAREAWANGPARALFDLFLSHKDGVASAEARRLLSPQDPSHRGNSALYTALYQLERALPPGAIIREGDRYRLAPSAAEEGLRALAS